MLKETLRILNDNKMFSLSKVSSELNISSEMAEDIILQLLKHFIKEVQLEGHLVRLAIEQIEIRIVSICLNEYDVLCLNPYKFR